MHDKPPSTDQMVAAIKATTDCTCDVEVVVTRHRRGRTKVQARHQPSCPVHLGHQRIHMSER